jgi:hypothetical protein
MSIRRICFILCGLALLAIPVALVLSGPEDAQPKPEQPATAVAREDLGGLNNPAGIQVLPASTSKLLDKMDGNVFTFSNKQLIHDPSLRDGKERGKYVDFLKSLVDPKIGDILYDSADGGYFIVPSGMISDLGEHYLYEFGGKEWPFPKVCEEINDKGFGGKGLLFKPRVGHCYAMLSLDGNRILFRIVALSNERAAIQWILNSRGGGKPGIPKSELIAPEDEPVPFVPELLLVDIVVSKNLQGHLQYRNSLIKKLIAVAKDETLYYSERENAVNLLGVMRAEEAASDLINMISFTNPGKKTLEDTDDYFAAFEALVRIGKPASLAAVKAMSSLDAYNPKDVRKWAHNWQLTTLIVRIEGPTMAKLILEDAMTEELKLAGEKPKDDDPHKMAADNLKEAIDMVAQIPSYE